MAFKVKVQITGLEATFRKMDGLKQSLRNKIVRTWMTKAGRVVKNEAKRLAPVLKDKKKYPHLIPGLLKKSIDAKVVTFKSNVVVAIIGPRSDFRSVRDPGTKKVVRQTKKGKERFAELAKAGAFIQNPTKYAHLLELGTSKMAAQPFLRPAIAAKRSEVVSMGVRIINEELAKLAAKKAA